MTPEQHRRRLDEVVASEWRLVLGMLVVLVAGALADLLR